MYCASGPKPALKIASLSNLVASITAKQTQKKIIPLGDKEKEKNIACDFYFEFFQRLYHTIPSGVIPFVP